MGDNLMNDYLVTYIDRDIFNSIGNEEIIQRFYTYIDSDIFNSIDYEEIIQRF